jgi:aminoglycoside 3-N-acetyltransferase
MAFSLQSSWFRKTERGDGRAAFAEGLVRLGVWNADVLVHTSFKSLASTVPDPEDVVDVLGEVASTLLMPAFSYQTFAWQSEGAVPGNAYPEDPESDPDPFNFDTPISKSIGLIPELMRHRGGVRRSPHPWLSFIAHGSKVETLVSTDDGPAPLGPIHRLYQAGGMVLLLGVGHTSSTALHLAERYENRPSFLRHARTEAGVVEVWDNGCSDAFGDAADAVRDFETSVTIGQCRARAYPIRKYVDAARALLRADSTALLCRSCGRCQTQRARIAAEAGTG